MGVKIPPTSQLGKAHYLRIAMRRTLAGPRREGAYVIDGDTCAKGDHGPQGMRGHSEGVMVWHIWTPFALARAPGAMAADPCAVEGKGSGYSKQEKCQGLGICFNPRGCHRGSTRNASCKDLRLGDHSFVAGPK